MILHRLRMQNYRVFEELTEVEFGAGLIGIHGANGAGKSSLIGAIPWALYGRSPTKVGLARTTGTQGTCVVELEFEHEGHLYRVVREVAGDLGMPRTQAAAYVDGLQVTTGTKAVTTYVESVLGMSESAFLASVFTEQKQLAAFSNRQPRERAELVVRLLGVKPLDTAIDAARVDMRATEAHARQLAADVGDVEPLQTRVDAARDARVAGERVLELATTAATAAQDAVDAAQRELNDVRAIAMQVNALRERRIAVARDLSRIERQEAELGAELAELESARDELEKLAPRVGDLAAAQEAARLWEAWLTARERVAATAAPAEPDHATLLDATEQARRADAEEVAARAALEEAVSDASSARERQRQLAEMVRRVAQLDRSVPCPSCGQALGESFGQSRRHFSAELDHAAAAATAASKRAEAARTAAAVAAKAASAAREAAAAARAAAERAALVAERRERDVEALTAAAAAVSQAWLEQWGPRPALGLDGEHLSAADPAVDEHTRRLRLWVEDLQVADRRAAELKGLLANREVRVRQFAELGERRRSCEVELEQLDATAAHTPFDDDLLATAQRRATVAARELVARRSELDSARDAAARARTEHDMARGALAHAIELQERAAAVARDARELVRLVQLLTGFKSSVVASIGESLAAEAAQLFAELTDGEYEGLQVDPKTYDMEIRDAGVWHPLERFSGSEQDLANLALRVAISEHVRFQSGGVVGLLVLDEVFGSLDAQRRDAMLVALERLQARFRQILVVTHADDVKDQLPLSITVEKLPGRRARVV